MLTLITSVVNPIAFFGGACIPYLCLIVAIIAGAATSRTRRPLLLLIPVVPAAALIPAVVGGFLWFGELYGGLRHLPFWLIEYCTGLGYLWVFIGVYPRLPIVLRPLAGWGFLMISGAAYVFYPGQAIALVDHFAFSTVVVAGLILTAAWAREGYVPWGFLVILLFRLVALMAIVWPVIWEIHVLLLRPSEAYSFPIQRWLPFHFAVGAMGGVGVFFMLLPFLIMTFTVPYFRTRFEQALYLDPSARAQASLG